MKEFIADRDMRILSKHILPLYNTTRLRGDCFEWKGCRNDIGYGHIWLNGHTILAHRASFIVHNKIYPKNLVLHSCDNPLCIRPSHLWEGTHKDNGRDCSLKLREANQKKLFCKYGHLLTPPGSYIRRICVTCRKIYLEKRMRLQKV